LLESPSGSTQIEIREAMAELEVASSVPLVREQQGAAALVKLLGDRCRSGGGVAPLITNVSVPRRAGPPPEPPAFSEIV